jgi:ERCC4-type nuclease
MEDELRRYYNNADENNQIIEGIISPFRLTKEQPRGYNRVSVRRETTGQLYTYKVEPNGYIHSAHCFETSSSEYFAWIRGLSRAGIATYYTINYVDTARLLSAIYRNEHKPPDAHTTLNRYTRPKIYIQEHNPFVKALMYLSAAYKLGIGEEKAKSIAARYKTIFDINMAEINELCECEGIGRKIAIKLLEALGREL